MEFKIVRAVPDDVDTLDNIMRTVKDQMEHTEWFIADDRAYIEAHIGHEPISETDCGFILKAVTMVEEKETIAGFLMVAFPGIGEKNLGHHLQMPKEKLEKVAHMDSALVLPTFRGNRLQYRMIQTAEQILQEQTAYRICMATVHPQNRYSLQNALQNGYEIKAEALKYGGYPRYILLKSLEENVCD